MLDQNERPILFDDTMRPFCSSSWPSGSTSSCARLQGAQPPTPSCSSTSPACSSSSARCRVTATAGAKDDLEQFFAQIERPRGIHLCGNPDWDFLLGLDLDVLSLDIYTNADIFSAYGAAIGRFLERGGVIVWGLAPTQTESFAQESSAALIQRLERVWAALCAKGVDRDFLLSRSLLSPATCCLINPDREKTVEAAFDRIRQISRQLREHYRLES